MHKLSRLNITLTLILNFFFCFGFCSNPQKNITDSIQQVLSTTDEASEKRMILIQGARDLKDIDRAQAISFYQQALDYETNAYNKAVILDTIGLYYWQLGKFEKAIGNFEDALIYFQELNDSLWLGKIYNNIAVVNWGLGNSNEALKYYHKALPIRSAINDHKGVANIYNNIGIIYKDWDLNEEAFKWHTQALSEAKKSGDLNAIAYSNFNIGKYYEYKDEFETALKYHQEGYRNLLNQDKNNRSISLFLANVGSLYAKSNQLDSALYYFKASLFHAKRINNNNRIAIAQYFVGKTYLKIEKPDSAKIYIDESYRISKENGYNFLEKDNMFIYSELAEKQGNASEALDYFKKATALKDSIFNKGKINKLTELQIRYNLDQQSQENLLLRKNIEIQQLTIHKQNATKAILIVSSILILIILAFILKSRKTFKDMNVKLLKSKDELKKLNADKDKFFSIISHDLKAPFQGLLSIADIIDSEYNKFEDEELKNLLSLQKQTATNAYRLLESLLQWAQTQSGRITYTPKEFNLHQSSEKVIELLQPNSDKKKIKLSNKISAQTTVYADREATSTVLRNIITNAIKFSKPGGTITIETEHQNNDVLVSISDTGIGMNSNEIDKLFRIDVQHTTAGTEHETGTGLGLILCKELIKGQGGNIWVKSELGKGSTFYFTLPICSN